jgi:hypothetical protein
MPNVPKPIGPADSLKEYLGEALALEEFRGLRKKTKDGSTIGTKELSDIENALRNNDEAKVRAIDNLFESMANLIYFFQFMNNNPDILYRFKEDIEDLLGLTGQDVSKIDSKEPPFARLIREVIGEGNSAADTNFAYQTRLLHILQFLVKQRSDWIMMQLHEPPTKNEYEMRNLMIDDMKRAEVWMGYIDKFQYSKEKPSRVLDIP